MTKKSFLILVMVAAVALTGLAGCTLPGAGAGPQAASVNLNSQQGISVVGEGKITLVPDLALLYLGVSARKPTAVEAHAEASGAMEKVMAALAAASIEKKDIRTQNFSIQQVTAYDRDKQEQVVTGYAASNMVTVKVRAMDNAGAVIDSVVNAAGDLVRINGVSFSVENPEKYYDQARQKAVEDAANRAENLAALAGAKLGKAVYVSENAAYPGEIYPVVRHSYGLSMEGAVPETAISPGETDIVLTVQVNYSLEY